MMHTALVLLCMSDRSRSAVDERRAKHRRRRGRRERVPLRDRSPVV